MSDELSTEDYLRQMFEVIISEAAENSRFRNQLLNALGATVISENTNSAHFFDPRVSLQNKGSEVTRNALGRMRVPELRQICDRFGYDDDGLPRNRKAPFIDLIIAEAQQELDDR